MPSAVSRNSEALSISKSQWKGGTAGSHLAQIFNPGLSPASNGSQRLQRRRRRDTHVRQPSNPLAARRLTGQKLSRWYENAPPVLLPQANGPNPPISQVFILGVNFNEQKLVKVRKTFHLPELLARKLTPL